jgi:hypothetical protein
MYSRSLALSVLAVVSLPGVGLTGCGGQRAATLERSAADRDGGRDRRPACARRDEPRVEVDSAQVKGCGLADGHRQT